MEPFDLQLWDQFIEARDPSFPPLSTLIDQITIDSRRIDSGNALFVALPGNNQDGHQHVIHAAKAGARYALVQKNWVAPAELENIILLRVDDPLKAFQRIAACYRQQSSAKVIAITGSVGKTMLKDLLHSILSTTYRTMASPESFNSQIGVPLSLLSIRQQDRYAIIEAGISLQGEMDNLATMIAPDCSILTTIGQSHLNTLKNVETIAAEKMKLVQHPAQEWTLLPKDAHITPYTTPLSQKVLFWNEETNDLPHADYLSTENASRMPYRVRFPDGHLFEGVITTGFSYTLDLIRIAVKAAWMLGVSSEAISLALKNHVPEHMRSEIWKSSTGVTFINNTYCSDPQSVDLALKHLEDTPPQSKRIFVFGGIRDNNAAIDYRRIGKAINKTSVDLLILHGMYSYSPLISEVARGSKAEILTCDNYEEALALVQTRAENADLVLIKGAKKESIDLLIERVDQSIPSNQCIINLTAIQNNIETIRQRLAPHTRLMAIVKAFAYGTDEVRIGKFLSRCGIDILGVSHVEEGVALKRAGITQAIFVINTAPYEVAKAVKWDLEIAVSDRELIELVYKEATRQGRKVRVHLHIETGMNRFGCRQENALALAQQIVSADSLILEGIMTHFASAESAEEDPFTLKQVELFESTVQTLSAHGIRAPWVHAANSSAAMRLRLPQFNMVRLGLSIYGLYPSEATKRVVDLQLALSLTTRVVGINECQKGETISYGRTYTVTGERQRIAVLPIGYFDGLHRCYSGKGHVIIRGQKAPMVGRICMDYMMVDVTGIPNVTVGDSALIFGVDDHGQYLSPEDLATKGNTIAHELVTCLGPRIQRLFIDQG